MSSKENLSPDSKFTLSIKEIVAAAIGFASLIGMYYTLQAEIQWRLLPVLEAPLNFSIKTN